MRTYISGGKVVTKEIAGDRVHELKGILSRIKAGKYWVNTPAEEKKITKLLHKWEKIHLELTLQ